jgi:hypothetical protein
MPKAPVYIIPSIKFVIIISPSKMFLPILFTADLTRYCDPGQRSALVPNIILILLGPNLPKSYKLLDFSLGILELQHDIIVANRGLIVALKEVYEIKLYGNNNVISSRYFIYKNKSLI